MMSLQEQGLYTYTLNEAQRRYLQALVDEDLKSIASDILSAESAGRDGDASHLRLAQCEMLQLRERLNAVKVVGA